MNPHVPMTPEDLPQQRIYSVRELPQRPVGFHCWHTCEKKLDMAYIPKRRVHRQFGYQSYARQDESGQFEERMPRTAKFLASAEWASSPMNNSLVAYYISTNRQRSHWLLWSSYHDDNCWPFRWRHQLWAHGPKKGVSKHHAAIYLLLDCWTFERREWRQSMPDWISGSGLLSVPDLKAIFRKVWPGKELPQSETFIDEEEEYR